MSNAKKPISIICIVIGLVILVYNFSVFLDNKFTISSLFEIIPTEVEYYWFLPNNDINQRIDTVLEEGKKKDEFGDIDTYYVTCEFMKKHAIAPRYTGNTDQGYRFYVSEAIMAYYSKRCDVVFRDIEHYNNWAENREILRINLIKYFFIGALLILIGILLPLTKKNEV